MDLPGADLEMLRNSRGAGGIKVNDGAIELDFAGYSPDAGKPGDDVRDFVGDMDASGLGAIAFSISDDMYAKMAPEIDKLVDQSPEAAQFGITSVEDLKAVIGNKVGVTLGLDSAAQQPILGIKSETGNPDKQNQVLAPLFDQGVPNLEKKTDGNVTFIGFGQTPDAVQNPSSKLSDNDAFKKATEASGSVLAILFADLERVRALPDMERSIAREPAAKEFFDAVSGIGMVSSMGDDGYSKAHIRVIGK